MLIVFPELHDLAGVYAIENVTNGKRYVGSTRSFRKRLHQHHYDLRRGQHPNPALRLEFKQCGDVAFRFRVLEVVSDPDVLHSRELFHIGQRAEYNTFGTPNVVEYGKQTRDRIRAAPGRGVTSPFKGVYLHTSGLWVARLAIDKKQVRIGSYETELEAAVAYDRAVVEALGPDAAFTNFPIGDAIPTPEQRRNIDYYLSTCS